MTIEDLINALKMYPKDYKVKGKIFYKEKGDFVYPYFDMKDVYNSIDQNIKYGEKVVKIIDWDCEATSE